MKFSCKECGDEIDITFKNMLSLSKQHDIKYNRYDEDNLINYEFLTKLKEKYTHCYWDDCKVELQYIVYQDDLCTIERLDNDIGHIKSNCVFACLKCNRMKKSNN